MEKYNTLLPRSIETGHLLPAIVNTLADALTCPLLKRVASHVRLHSHLHPVSLVVMDVEAAFPSMLCPHRRRGFCPCPLVDKSPLASALSLSPRDTVTQSELSEREAALPREGMRPCAPHQGCTCDTSWTCRGTGPCRPEIPPLLGKGLLMLLEHSRLCYERQMKRSAVELHCGIINSTYSLPDSLLFIDFNPP